MKCKKELQRKGRLDKEREFLKEIAREEKAAMQMRNRCWSESKRAEMRGERKRENLKSTK